MQHHASTADAMDRCMDALRGKLDHAIALEGRSAFVEHDHVAGPRLGPMKAEREDQIAIGMSGQGDGEMVVYIVGLPMYCQIKFILF